MRTKTKKKYLAGKAKGREGETDRPVEIAPGKIGFLPKRQQSSWEKEMREKGWLRETKDYGTVVQTVSIPFQATTSREVTIHKYRYMPSPTRNRNTEFTFTERTPTGDSGRFSVECVRSGEYTHKGVPCYKINRSEKRGGVPMPLSELKKIPKSRQKVKVKDLGKPVNMRNFRR